MARELAVGVAVMAPASCPMSQWQGSSHTTGSQQVRGFNVCECVVGTKHCFDLDVEGDMHMRCRPGGWHVMHVLAAPAGPMPPCLLPV